jgi:hypothetical protein
MDANYRHNSNREKTEKGEEEEEEKKEIGIIT